MNLNTVSSATAFWITDKNHGELREVPLPGPAENEVRVKTLYSGISKGTESLVFAGKVPVSEYSRMRAPFQEGEFPYPVKYGYISIGHVESGHGALIGKTVFCLYPHQNQYNVPVSAVTVLPDYVPAERAVLTANMETAINALWDAQPSIGDRISVVGAGVVGSLVAYLAARIPGCNVQLIDINTQREKIAKALETPFLAPEKAQTDQDIVIHCSATEKGLNTALELAGFEATVIELSWFGDRTATINLGGAFHSQRLQIKGSQVGHIASPQRARWSYQRRLQLALSRLQDPVLDCLISGESHFSDLPDTLKELSSPGNTSLCQRIAYQ